LLPVAAPARITEKFVLAAKHEMIVLVNVPDAAVHGATASASPEYIIIPLACVVTLLPPINQRLYPPPTHNDVYTHANCVFEFGLLTPRFQLKPSLEK
jgi:hypothetical protein